MVSRRHRVSGSKRWRAVYCSRRGRCPRTPRWSGHDATSASSGVDRSDRGAPDIGQQVVVLLREAVLPNEVADGSNPAAAWRRPCPWRRPRWRSWRPWRRPGGRRQVALAASRAAALAASLAAFRRRPWRRSRAGGVPGGGPGGVTSGGVLAAAPGGGPGGGPGGVLGGRWRPRRRPSFSVSVAVICVHRRSVRSSRPPADRAPTQPRPHRRRAPRCTPPCGAGHPVRHPGLANGFDDEHPAGPGHPRALGDLGRHGQVMHGVAGARDGSGCRMVHPLRARRRSRLARCGSRSRRGRVALVVAGHRDPRRAQVSARTANHPPPAPTTSSRGLGGELGVSHGSITSPGRRAAADAGAGHAVALDHLG